MTPGLPIPAFRRARHDLQGDRSATVRLSRTLFEKCGDVGCSVMEYDHRLLSNKSMNLELRTQCLPSDVEIFAVQESNLIPDLDSFKRRWSFRGGSDLLHLLPRGDLRCGASTSHIVTSLITEGTRGQSHKRLRRVPFHCKVGVRGHYLPKALPSFAETPRPLSFSLLIFSSPPYSPYSPFVLNAPPSDAPWFPLNCSPLRHSNNECPAAPAIGAGAVSHGPQCERGEIPVGDALR